MREIKFRAWFKDAGEINNVAMNNVYKGNTSYMHLSPMPFSDYRLIELMQCTGLKDKNGVEIFEGDIVYSDEYDKNFVIEYAEDWSCFAYNTAKSIIDRALSTDRALLYSEVIGNIYEHKHLLEGESIAATN